VFPRDDLDRIDPPISRGAESGDELAGPQRTLSAESAIMNSVLPKRAMRFSVRVI
jgi:hypothetical protein